MLPDEVRDGLDAVERSLCANYLPSAPVLAQWQVLRAHLLAREAEVERHVKMLADCFRMAGADTDGNEDWRIAPDALRAVTDLRRDYDDVLDWQARCEIAEALLREARHRLLVLNEDRQAACISGLTDRITAHLSENSRGND